MEKSNKNMTSIPLLVENLKAIKILVGDALQEYCYRDDAENCAKYNFKRISATFEAIRTLNADTIRLLESDGMCKI